MLNDLIELTTTLVHPSHEPNISGPSTSHTTTMPPRSRHAKSSSIGSSSSAADAINGIVAGGPGSKSASPTGTATRRRPQSRSTASPSTSPVVVVPKPQGRTGEPMAMVERTQFEPLKWATTVVMSVILEAGFQTAASMFGAGDLAAVSKRTDTWAEILGLLGWKFVKLGIYWASDFDAYDVASLSLLLSTPSKLLLGLFYLISPLTLVTSTLSSILANSLPYYFFRPLSPSHHPNTAPRSTLRNRPILTDLYTAIATSLLATAIFAVLLEASFATYLPTWLIVHFEGLRTLEPAHLGPAGLPILLLALIPAGYAVMEFLFAPSTAAASSSASMSIVPETLLAPFDPATANFLQHLQYNTWGWYTARQKELIRRTVLLTGLIFAETVVTTWGTTAGVEIQGALGYAGIWAVGSIVTGAVLEWVGGPSD